MIASSKCIELIKFFEGLHDGDLKQIGIQPKLDCRGIYTIGWGHAIVDPVTKKFLTNKVKSNYTRACELFKDFTLEKAEALLKKDLIKFEIIVTKRVKVPLTQEQFDALISHTFNTGGSDTLFNLINNFELTDPSIKDWWEKKYITAGGTKKLPGLIKRRSTEYKLFSTGILDLK